MINPASPVPPSPAPQKPAPSKPGKPAPAKGKLRGSALALRILAWLLLVGLLAPIAQTGLLRWVDPPVTQTMLARTWSRGWQEGDWSLPTYRWASAEELPRPLVVAAISSEDRSFFAHHGFDVVAIRRAWHRYQTKPGARLVGGSTISQQVARNVFLWQRRSWVRKGLEAYYTLWLELLVPKQRILEVYLNIAELGPMVFGAEAAAQHWFGKPARRLTRQESALLVAMLPAPNTWTPKTAHVQRRAAWILRAGVPVAKGAWPRPVKPAN